MTDVQWILNAYYVPLVSFVLVAASLGDIVGHHRVFMAGLILFSLGALVCTIWIWSVVLILKNVPRGELITNGPYALIGIVLYIGSRMFAPEEEAALSKTFGAAWDAYCDSVWIPWL